MSRDWSIAEIAPGAWFVQRDWRSCNHFVALSPRVTLIDTGYGGDIEATTAVLAELGLRPADIGLIVNTHSHCDHVGGNAFLIRESGAEVWMHSREKARMDGRDAVGTWWRFHDTWADFFQVDRGLEDGDEVPFGPLTLRVIHAPGHAAGQIALHCEQLNILFSADAMWQGDMGVINPLVEGEDALALAEQTLRRFAGLGLKAVYPGHGPVIGNPKPVIDRLLRKLDRFAQDPAEMHYEHMCKMIAYVLLLKGGVPEDGFFEYLTGTMWFPRLVDYYFASDYLGAYAETMQRLTRKGMIARGGGLLLGAERK